jgi:hypothetical protein
MRDPLGRELEARPHILHFQIRQLPCDLFRSQSVGQEFQHILHAHAHTSDARLSAALIGIECDAIEAAHGGPFE